MFPMFIPASAGFFLFVMLVPFCGILFLARVFRVLFTFSTKEIFMADKSIVLTTIERNWLKKCIDLQIKSLVRSKGSEMSDSPVIAIRDQEIGALRGIEMKL